MIPSSINEVLVYPFSEGELDQKHLASLIGDVNTNCLDRTEILSDKAYIYTPDKGLRVWEPSEMKAVI